MTHFDHVVAEIQSHTPSLRVVQKESSKLMRFLAVLLKPFNKDFATRYTTTIGSTVYMPKYIIGTLEGALILHHEAVHVRDWKRWNILFSLSYLLLLPAVFTMRAFWEWRGYKESLRQNFLYFGEYGVDDHYIDFYVEQFCSSNYLWMWPFKKQVKGWFQKWRAELRLSEKPRSVSF